MKRSSLFATTPLLAASLAFFACGHAPPSEGRSTSEPLSNAAYTTFDATMDGCLDSPNGINCNKYASKDDVYMNGGPVGNNLPDGTYFFAVIAPGAQDKFFDGTGLLSLDGVDARTFSMLGGVVQYPVPPGTHGTGTSPSPEDKFIVQLSPYDNTPNPGDVYILAICTIGADSPSDCKFDAFKAPPSQPPPDAGPDVDACPPDPPTCDWTCTLDCSDPCNCFCNCDP
jgi:hypothetical protein